MQLNCKGCGKDKPEDQMVKRLGKPIRLCEACFSLQHQVKHGDGKRAKKGKAKASMPAVVAAIESLPAHPGPVTLDRSWGVSAAIEEGVLALRQSGDGGRLDEIFLSKAEARAIAERFGAWWA